MADRLAHRDMLFARLTEFRPVVRDGPIVIDESAVGDHMECEGEHTLEDRSHADDGVAFPFAASVEIDVATPEIDYTFPLPIDANRRAQFIEVAKINFEGFPHRFELLGAEALGKDLVGHAETIFRRNQTTWKPL